MLRLLFICAIVVIISSCGSGWQKPDPNKDSIPGTTDTITGTGMGTVDSTNGAAVRPIDTASSQRRHPKQ